MDSCDSELVCVTCSDNYYFDSDTDKCLDCAYPCVTCLTETFCLTCGFAADKRIHPPNCSCQEGLSETKDPIIGCI